MTKRRLAWIVITPLAALLLAILVPLGWGALLGRSAAGRIHADATRFAGGWEPPQEWRVILLAVEDPAFERHGGVDFSTPGAGLTTITQGLAKRYCFERFAPGVIAKLVQTGCALRIDGRVSKAEQLAVFVHTAGLGPGESGWISGFPAAAREYFAKEPGDLTTREFTTLVAMVLGPARYHPRRGPELLADRVARIERLLAGACAPAGLRDVTYEACR